MTTNASATSPVTLYVNSSASGSSCLDSSTDACQTIQAAINVAETYANSVITIDVAAGTYKENDTINVPSSDTLTIHGVAAATTLVDGTYSGSVFTIGAGGPVILNYLTIENGVTTGADSTLNPDGDGYGGGIDNASGDLTVDDSILSNNAVYGAATGFSPGGNAYGGAIYDASGELLISGDTFSNNTAWGGGGNGPYAGGFAEGGAVDVAGGTLYGEFDTFSQDGAHGGLGGVLVNGFAGGESWGGAVYSSASRTSFSLSTFSADSANGGGGRQATINGTGGTGGSAYGGALFIPSSVAGNATVDLTKDTFYSDEATGGEGGAGMSMGQGGSAFGGGFYDGAQHTTTATLTDDTFNQDSATAGGSADAIGGAIDNTASTASALNVTLASNTVTSSGNEYGAGIENGGTFTVTNSILDQDKSCDGTFIDGGYNVESDHSCGFGASDVVNSSTINLAALATNGSSGPETMAIDHSSSAYEEAPDCTYGFDERGEPQPGVTGAYCDAGAYEWQGYTVTYDANGGSGGPTDSNTYGPGENVNVLFGSPPTLTGYGFGGWCTVQESPDDPCTGEAVPHSTFPVTGLTMGTANITLYALWDITRTLYVNGNDNGIACTDQAQACPTIQSAINKAESMVETSVTIDVAPGTYNESDEIDLMNNDTIDIVGAGVNSSYVSDSSDSDFIVDLGLVNFQNLTIEDGQGFGSGGGGIRNYGAVIATNDTFLNDHGQDGGAIYNDGTLIATNDTFDNDAAGTNGGAIYIPEDGYLVATNDTFSENEAVSGGAGIYNDSLETAAQIGPSDSFFTFYASAAIVTNDTFEGDFGDHYGDAITDQGSPTTISNSILDDSQNCYGSFPFTPDGGYNVESDDTCDFTGSSLTDNSNLNLASSLAANGSNGPETFAIDPTSSAYQEVPSAYCTLTTDERGDLRPGAGANCDAGSFEYEAPYIPPTSPGPTTTTTTTTTTTSVTLSFASDGGSAVASVSGISGSTVTLPAAPTFAGHTFEGWFTQASGGTLAGDGGATYTLTGPLTLYAQWIAASPSVLLRLGSVHTFATDSSTLSRTLRNQVAAFDRVISARHYVEVNLEGESSLPASAAHRQLALARAHAVEAYLKAHGLAEVHFTLSETVTGTTQASSIVVVISG